MYLCKQNAKKMEHANLKSWAGDDRPREKLLKRGTAALSDTELTAILLRTGTRNETVVELARRILASVGNNLDELGKLGVDELRKNFKGIGETKAVTLIAALELGRRRKSAQAMERRQITCSRDVAQHFQPLLADLPHEEFWTMTLNRQHKVIDMRCVGKGGVSATAVDAKIVLKMAVEQLASAIVLCHNHPSGNLQPSRQDIDITDKLKNACHYLDIQLLDHIIIGGQGYYSFADSEQL